MALAPPPPSCRRPPWQNEPKPARAPSSFRAGRRPRHRARHYETNPFFCPKLLLDPTFRKSPYRAKRGSRPAHAAPRTSRRCPSRHGPEGPPPPATPAATKRTQSQDGQGPKARRPCPLATGRISTALQGTVTPRGHRPHRPPRPRQRPGSRRLMTRAQGNRGPRNETAGESARVVGSPGIPLPCLAHLGRAPAYGGPTGIRRRYHAWGPVGLAPEGPTAQVRHPRISPGGGARHVELTVQDARGVARLSISRS